MCVCEPSKFQYANAPAQGASLASSIKSNRGTRALSSYEHSALPHSEHKCTRPCSGTLFQNRPPLNSLHSPLALVSSDENHTHAKTGAAKRLILVGVIVLIRRGRTPEGGLPPIPNCETHGCAAACTRSSGRPHSPGPWAWASSSSRTACASPRASTPRPPNQRPRQHPTTPAPAAPPPSSSSSSSRSSPPTSMQRQSTCRCRRRCRPTRPRSPRGWRAHGR